MVRVLGLFFLAFAFSFHQIGFAQTPEEKDVLAQILKSIPSPFEISSLIKEVGVQYKDSLLNSPDKAATYDNAYKRALNLGIYSTDLGYLNVYKKADSITSPYLQSILAIAEKMEIDDQIDFVAIAKYAFTSNLNGLLSETSSAFDKINQALVSKSQPELAVLMLSGGWLETLYLTCQVASAYPSKVLDDKIAEQKLILEQLLPILETYKSGEEMDSLFHDFQELNALFSDIKIKQNKKSSQNFRIEKWGDLEVVVAGFDDKSNKRNIKYDQEDINNILLTSSKIREGIVQ